MAVHKAIFYGTPADASIIDDIEIIQLCQAFHTTPKMILADSPEWIVKAKLILSEMAKKEEYDSSKERKKGS